MDRPDQPRDQPPKSRPWSDEDMPARLDRLPRNHPSSPYQRRDQPTRTGPQQWRDHWYQQHYGDVPAPFRPDVADRVPTSSKGAKGRLDRHDGGDGLPLSSGYKTGLVEVLEHRIGQLPDAFTKYGNKTHVEAHAAAWLHLNPQVKNATLYLNAKPCPYGCRIRQYFSGGQETYAPAWSLVPAEQARQAARQFVTSAGQQPSNIAWRTG